MFEKRDNSKDEVMLVVKGPLNGNTADEFQEQLAAMAQGPQGTIVLNLADVNSINSSCIGKILLFRKKLFEEGRSIEIRGCSDALFNTFQLIKFDKLIPIRR